jgi:hypothetical protein
MGHTECSMLTATWQSFNSWWLMDLCNPDMHGYCRCPVPVNAGPCIINKDVTYYHKAGILRIRGRVWKTVNSPSNGWGLHFFKEMLQIQDREGIKIDVFECGNIAEASVYYARSTNMPNRPSCGLLRVEYGMYLRHLYLVRKIQTWVRRALKTRRQKRRLAFAMGMHARLGCQSVVMGLHSDTLRLIL